MTTCAEASCTEPLEFGGPGGIWTNSDCSAGRTCLDFQAVPVGASASVEMILTYEIGRRHDVQVNFGAFFADVCASPTQTINVFRDSRTTFTLTPVGPACVRERDRKDEFVHGLWNMPFTVTVTCEDCIVK